MAHDGSDYGSDSDNFYDIELEGENGDDNGIARMNLENISHNLTSAKRKLITTSSNHYKKYLEYTGSAFRNIEEVTFSDSIGDAEEDLGKFSDYLFKVATKIKRWKSHSQYIGIVTVHEIYMSFIAFGTNICPLLHLVQIYVLYCIWYKYMSFKSCFI